MTLTSKALPRLLGSRFFSQSSTDRAIVERAAENLRCAVLEERKNKIFGIDWEILHEPS